MKTTIKLNNSSYLFYFPCKNNTSDALLIIPNAAGYFAESKPEKYGKAAPRIDKFCDDLSQKFNVYYVVFPGQDLINYPEARYSYTGSINAAKEAFNFVAKKHKLIGVIGMCTGSAIAAEVMEKINLKSLPLILYNTASSVGWSNPVGHKAFLNRYEKFVKLDEEELLKNAPYSLVPLIQKHMGRMLLIASGNSDYDIEKQEKLADRACIQIIKFPTMSDAPIGESVEYQPMMELIFEFFSKK